ncbi:MAG: hypothetical protein Q4A74_09395 [Cardiobacteriaceae bacterium]|nr:hypothetical protein [Cardiobacteriaceae bacterium]
MTYTKYNDAGHGWLEVPISELKRLNIADKISGFSYRDGDTAFLEEDDDLSLFWEAKEERGESLEINHIFSNYSPVRAYAGYHYP